MVLVVGVHLNADHGLVSIAGKRRYLTNINQQTRRERGGGVLRKSAKYDNIVDAITACLVKTTNLIILTLTLRRPFS